MIRHVESTDARKGLAALRADAAAGTPAHGVHLHSSYLNRASALCECSLSQTVRQEGIALQYAAQGFRADREVVLAAVRQYTHTLMYASAKLHSCVIMPYEGLL